MAARGGRLSRLSNIGAAALAYLVGFSPNPCGAEPRELKETCDSLLAKTQAFSDAGQLGNGAALAINLDKRVVFFNEGGDRSTRAEMAAATPVAIAGVKTTMTVKDWGCELHGLVAVTSFIDQQDQETASERFRARYRSVETWSRETGAWLMIASQTVALYDDPTTIELPPATLDGYVGTYRSEMGQSFSFARRGGQIFASTNGGPSMLQQAEVRDVLFTPGRARFRKVFQRDQQDRITGFVVRREGHDTLFQRQG